MPVTGREFTSLISDAHAEVCSNCSIESTVIDLLPFSYTVLCTCVPMYVTPQWFCFFWRGGLVIFKGQNRGDTKRQPNAFHALPLFQTHNRIPRSTMNSNPRSIRNARQSLTHNLTAASQTPLLLLNELCTTFPSPPPPPSN